MIKTAVIIGGSKGIGKEICNKFLSNGYVVINGSRTKANLNHENFYNIKLDVRSEKNFLNFYKEVSKITNKINVLVNNTGISEWKSLKKISTNFIYNIFETNVFYIFWSCKYAMNFFEKNSSIINISSIAGKRGSKNNSAYSATKFAVNGITQSLAKELGSKFIRVNAICPVLIETPGLIKALGKNDSPSFKIGTKKFLKDFKKVNSAMGQLPSSYDVADFAFYLASNSNNSITGQCINLDCGVFPQ